MNFGPFVRYVRPDSFIHEVIKRTFFRKSDRGSTREITEIREEIRKGEKR